LNQTENAVKEREVNRGGRDIKDYLQGYCFVN
jgi:hypothetical protein